VKKKPAFPAAADARRATFKRQPGNGVGGFAANMDKWRATQDKTANTYLIEIAL
jgi:hypothetical protein